VVRLVVRSGGRRRRMAASRCRVLITPARWLGVPFYCRFPVSQL